MYTLKINRSCILNVGSDFNVVKTHQLAFVHLQSRLSALSMPALEMVIYSAFTVTRELKYKHTHTQNTSDIQSHVEVHHMSLIDNIIKKMRAGSKLEIVISITLSVRQIPFSLATLSN